MSAFTSAGTVLAISAGLPATETQVGYEALTFTTVAEITDIPEFGKAYELVTHNPIGDRKTRKFKGSYNNGSFTLALARDVTDAGQVIVSAANDSDANYSIKITYSDGSVDYFQAKIFSYTTNVGSVNSVTGSSVQIEIDTDIVPVAA